MYKALILYPYKEGEEFNFDYYCNNHMPMVQERLGNVCTGIGVDAGIGGAGPDMPPEYVAIGYILTDDLEKFSAAVSQHNDEFRNDMPNYYSVPPVIQINEVKL